MTADSAALVDKVAALYWDKYQISDNWLATAAIDLIRAETLEEAAKVAETEAPASNAAFAIRTLKSQP